MATKIVLLSANRHKDPYPVYPLGTAYLKGYLTEYLSDCAIQVWDMNLMSETELGKLITEWQPDFICVSLRNVDGVNSLENLGFIDDYKQTIGSIRRATTAPLIVGGAGFSIFPEQFMAELGADYGIRGEGEEALCRLIDALRTGSSIEQIPQLYTPEGANNLPCNYIKEPKIIYEPHLVEYYWQQSGMLNIQTKRGCPYECIYCTYPQIDGRCVRTMEVESIVETIARAKQDFGANYWFFTDSVFNINNRFNEEFAQALIRRDLDISWGAYFSPSNITDAQMSLYKRSGLTHIEFGTESFCDETLRAYGKRFTFEDVMHTSELALKYNVFYSHFIILAGWGETEQQLRATIENSKKLHHTVIFPYVGMRIYPNTPLYRYSVAEGVIDALDPLLEQKYYIANHFDMEATRTLANLTGKAWIFPDAPQNAIVDTLKLKRNKKGPLWEYLRRA